LRAIDLAGDPESMSLRVGDSFVDEVGDNDDDITARNLSIISTSKHVSAVKPRTTAVGGARGRRVIQFEDSDNDDIPTIGNMSGIDSSAAGPSFMSLGNLPGGRSTVSGMAKSQTSGPNASFRYKR
jgi:hypothetical protein